MAGEKRLREALLGMADDLDGLADAYTVNAPLVAEVCDEVLDRSGGLLGRVRQRVHETGRSGGYPALAAAREPVAPAEAEPGLRAALPSYVTAQVLDQWEASAIEDEARGTSWAVNPTTLRQVLPALRAALAQPPAPVSADADEVRRALWQFLRHKSGCESLNPRVKGSPFDACNCGMRPAIEAAIRAATPEPPVDTTLDVERLAMAIHESSGTHSMTPTRMLCQKPQWSGHRILAERILARLADMPPSAEGTPLNGDRWENEGGAVK